MFTHREKFSKFGFAWSPSVTIYDYYNLLATQLQSTICNLSVGVKCLVGFPWKLHLVHRLVGEIGVTELLFSGKDAKSK